MIHREVASSFQEPSGQIALEDEEKTELLAALEQMDWDRELEDELGSLQVALRGERWPGEPRPVEP